MAKPVTKSIARILTGLLPSLGTYHEITLLSDNTIRIVRPWCQLDPRKQMPTIEETDAFPHRHLIGLIEPKAYTDIRYL